MTAQATLAKRYVAYRALISMWFVGAIWLYFYRLFIDDQQVGVLDAMAFCMGLLAEIPSGALADTFGRDKLVRSGLLLAGGGLLVQAIGGSFLVLVAGQASMMIGMAFISGADEALFYRNLQYKKSSSDWRRLVARGSQASLLGTLGATLLGGWLYTFNPRIPWILNGIVFLCAAALIWHVKDSRDARDKDVLRGSLQHYIANIRRGFTQFRLPTLAPYVPFLLAVQTLFYITGYGLLGIILLDRFHFSPFWGAAAIAISNILTIGILWYMHRHAERFREKHVLGLIGCSAAAGLLLSVADIGAWGFIVIFILYAGEHLLHPFLSEALNSHAHEAQRATVLSVASFFKSMPYLILAPLLGYLNLNGRLEIFLAGWSVLIVVAVLLYLRAKRHHASYVKPPHYLDAV